jgi:ribose/xylose/arabinose/galactoside ABC-type transport system permease subunit
MVRVDANVAVQPAPPAITLDPPRSGASRRLLRAALSEYTVLLLSVVYFLVAWAVLPELATGRNLSNLVGNVLPLLAVAVGQTVVLIAGGIDLSVTSIIAAASVAAARLMTSPAAAGGYVPHPAAVPWAIAAALAIGAGVGLFNGAAIAGLRLPAFVVTLSTMMILSGAVLWATRSRNIGNLPDAFTQIGFGSVAGVPYAFLLVFALAASVHLLLARTLPGHWLYATGHNPTAAMISGVPVRRVTAAAYVTSGFCAAVAAVLYSARLESGSPTMGREILLDVIGATVIGGTSLFGGKGKVIWTVFGVTLFALIDNTLSLLGREYFEIMTIKGAVILVAAGVDVLRVRVLGKG